MKKPLAVSLGGIVGSLTRYLISESIVSYALSIFIANIVGVAVAGLIAYHDQSSEFRRALLIPGFAGGLTTFSSVALIHAERNSLVAIGYFYGTVFVSLLTLVLIRKRSAK